MKQDKFHSHYLSIVEKMGAAIWVIIIFLVNNLQSLLIKGLSGKINPKELIWVVIVAAFVLVYVIYNILVWRKTWIYLDGKAIIIEKNTLNKKVDTIGLSNVSNVNLEQNLFERIFALYKIKLDTNSMSTAKGPDMKIVLGKKKAEEFRKEIMLIIEGKEQSSVNENKQEIYDIKYKFSHVVRHAIYSTPILSVIALIGSGIALAFQITGMVSDSSNEVNVKTIIGILLVVISFASKPFKDLFKFYDFKVGRKGDKLYLSYGFLTKRKYTIPVDKINAIIIDEPPFSRILKRRNAEIVNIGFGDEAAETAQLLLSSKKEEFKMNLQKLLPEFEIEDNLQAQPKRSILLSLVPLIIFWAIIIGSSILMTKWLLFLLILPLINMLLSYRTSGLKVGERQITIASGTYGKRIKYIRYENIQFMQIKQGIISKPLKLSKASIHILASLTNMIHQIGYYDNQIFDKINEKVC